MKLLSILLCIVAAYSSYSQDLLLKTDGTTIPYKKIKWDDGMAILTTDKNQKVTVREEEVFGKYEEFNQRVSYKKPNVPLVQGKNKEVSGFQFLQKEESGAIKLYMTTIPSGSSTAYSYYAEKGNELKNIMITHSFDTRDDLLAFKSLFTDDRQITDEIEAKGFVYSIKNMVRLIKKYNWAHFENPTAQDYKTVGTIGFYTKAEGKVKADIVLRVNDSLEYKMPATYHPLPIKVPVNKPSKICVVWDGGSACELVEPIPYATTYYEVGAKLNRTFELEKKTFSEFRSYTSKAIQSK